MDKHPPDILVRVFHGCRLALHLLYGMLLATFYPHQNQARQRRTLKAWSKQLLINIGIPTEEPQVRAAREAIVLGLQDITPKKQKPEITFVLPQALLSAQSGYVLLLDTTLSKLPK